MIVITTPAADANLLSAAEMRLAAGLADNDTSQDASLALLNARISADIHSACRIAIGAGSPATLRRETITETLRLESKQRGKFEKLRLARRHEVTITSVTADNELLSVAEYEVDPESGLLTRLENDEPWRWYEAKFVIVYAAGFSTVPADLIGAASDLVRLRTSELSRDPLAKRERVKVDGVDEVETDYWVNAAGTSSLEGPVPPDIARKLRRYMNPALV